MKNLLKLQKRHAALVAEMRELSDKVTAEDRAFTDKEHSTYDDLETEIAAVSAAIEREKRLIEREKSLDVVPDVNADTPREKADRAGVQVREAYLDDPRRGFKSGKDFLLAVRAACVPGGRVDDRIKGLRVSATVGSDEHQGGADQYGGFAIPVGFLPQMLQVGVEMDPTVGTTSIPMSSPRVQIPARVDKNHSSSVSGGLRFYRRAETTAATASKMEMELIELNATVLTGLAYASEELLADSAISFTALLEAGFRDEFTATMINERLNGTGAGQYLGVMNSPALVTVAKESGQAADTIVWQNIVKMRSRCWGYQNAVWLCNHDCLPQLMQLSMPIGTGGVAMWQVNGSEGSPNTLLGRPVIATEFCDTVGDLGDIVLANWSQYIEGTYSPLMSDESMHVRFEYNERAFRFGVRNAGAPWWRSSLTTKNSSNTLSPFVTLAARA